jgi:hypothetical protein
MDVEYDSAKNARNVKARALSFFIRKDDRTDYGEVRWIALGFLDGRLHVLVFTETRMGIRVISFRKANLRERNAYEQAQATDR